MKTKLTLKSMANESVNPYAWYTATAIAILGMCAIAAFTI